MCPGGGPHQGRKAQVVRFGRVIDRADGYVILTAEYNHGYPAVLKNALDSTFVEWRRKPMAFVGWGNTGGAAWGGAAARRRGGNRDGAAAPRRPRAARRHASHLRFGRSGRHRALRAAESRLALLAPDAEWWMRALATARAAGG